MLYTTLNKIRDWSPCEYGWKELLKYLNKTAADDEPLAIATILESNGLDDTLWCLRTVPEHNKLWRLYAVWCARQVQHLMTDPRSLAALDTAERHANGLASDEELAAAHAAAYDSAYDSAHAAAHAAAYAAAFDSACDSARAKAYFSAYAAAYDSARAAAFGSARAAQKTELLRILEDN